MQERHVEREALAGKVIDCHSHAGVALKYYACVEYPYAQTIEGLFYQQKAADVDINVVFPFSPDLYFDPISLKQGKLAPSRWPLSWAPYAVENEMLLSEVFVFCPELSERFIPFVSIDPGRDFDAQLKSLQTLEERFPIYGIKISPVLCQSKITDLLGPGRDFAAYARERDLPVLLHTTADPREEYSQAADAFRVIEGYPDLRVCLAHCIGFHRDFLKLADEAPNVWVDTAALTIQTQLAREDSPIVAKSSSRFEADFSDHRKVIRALMEQFPETVVWGSDSPAYSYICRRQQAEGIFEEFRLKAGYEDEKAALEALPDALRLKACNANPLRFLFG